MQEYDVIIIGSGPAGLTASIYTGRAQLTTLILEGATLGGNTALTDHIDNYPGFPDGIGGVELIDNMWTQAQRFGAELKYEQAVGLKDLGDLKQVITNSGDYLARSVIVAVGVKRRELGLSKESEFIGRGISYCATCDGAFFQGAPVAVVGGGESALKEALYLSNIASRVHLIHWLGSYQANPSVVEKVLGTGNIIVHLNKTVKEINGEDYLQKLVLEDTLTKTKEELEAEGLFISIGMIASGEFLQPLLKHEDGYVLTNDDLELATSMPGVFAAGDIRHKIVRQVATAVGDGAIAGMAVTEFLK